MIADLIWTISIIGTIIIVVFAIGYSIWFMTYWNRMQREKEEIIRRILQRQSETFMRSLSNENKEDA